MVPKLPLSLLPPTTEVLKRFKRLYAFLSPRITKPVQDAQIFAQVTNRESGPKTEDTKGHVVEMKNTLDRIKADSTLNEKVDEDSSTYVDSSTQELEEGN